MVSDDSSHERQRSDRLIDVDEKRTRLFPNATTTVAAIHEKCDLSESIHRYLPHLSSTKHAEAQCKDHHHSLAEPSSEDSSLRVESTNCFSLHGIEDVVSSARLRILWLVRRAQKRTFTIEMIL
jgi:hypothetical protein